MSGITEKDGKIDFGRVDEGDYAVAVSAEGYNPSPPTKVKVKRKTEYTARLDKMGGVLQVPSGSAPLAPALPEGEPGVSPSGAPAVAPTPPASPAAVTPQPRGEGAVQPTAEPPPTQPEAEGLELEGWGGGRIEQIIKTFQAKGAVSPETALTAEELGLSRIFVRIMKRRKGKTRVFMEVNGKYYLNQKALQERP